MLAKLTELRFTALFAIVGFALTTVACGGINMPVEDGAQQKNNDQVENPNRGNDRYDRHQVSPCDGNDEDYVGQVNGQPNNQEDNNESSTAERADITAEMKQQRSGNCHREHRDGNRGNDGEDGIIVKP